MRAIKGIIVELENKHLSYNGVDMEYNFVTKEAKTSVFTNLSMVSDFNSPLFCPDRGLVVDSDDPEILPGDTVILDYFAVVRKLGQQIEQFQQAPQSIYEEVDGKIRIPVRTIRSGENYVYGIFRDGKFVEYNGFQVVIPIVEPITDKLHTVRFDKVTQKYVDTEPSKKCLILYGEYAGMTCVFRPEYLLGEAQQSIIDGKQVRFIQKEYVIAQVV